MPGTRDIRGPMQYENTAVITAVTATYTMVNEAQVTVKKTAGAPTAVVLPANPVMGREVVIKDGKGDAGTNNITITAPSAGTIDGQSSLVLAVNYASTTLRFNGTEWNVVDLTLTTAAGNHTVTGTLTVQGLSQLQGNTQITGLVTNFADNSNIALGTANGTQLGGNANQKLGVFGATPVVQPSSTGELLGLNGNAAIAANATNMNTNGNLGNTNYGFNDLVKAMKQFGLLKQ